tara:strand:+ start:252 stop:629 length:378 start_codon:yes stop_codon:yes gene_type:complete
MQSNDSIFDHSTVYYGWSAEPRQFPDTLPDGRIFVSQDIIGVDTFNYYTWLPIPKSTMFQAMEITTTQTIVSAPKHHIEIYSHPKQMNKPLQWEQSGSMLSYCGLSLGIAVWLGCISAKLLRLSV